MKNKSFISLFFVLIVSNVLLASQGMQDATTYNKNSKLQWEWAMDSLKKFPFEGNEIVLDIGCGDGKITCWIAEQVSRGYVFGVDISTRMIDFAKENYPQDRYPNLEFMEFDARTMTLSACDAVVSFCALHWVLEQDKALKNIEEGLRPGGKVLIVMPAKEDNNLSTLCEKLARTPKWAPFFPLLKPQRVYYTPEEYESLLVQAGLEPLSIQCYPSWMEFENKNGLMAWLRPLVTFTRHLPDSLQEEFLKDVVKETLVFDPPLSNGVIKVHSTKLEVIAQKPL